MSDKTYCYPPHYKVLINNFGYRGHASLQDAEKRFVRVRMEAGKTPSGNFDLPHLQAIHKYLFQDVYEWAGDLRTVPLAKGESHFMPSNRISTAMRDVHDLLEEQKFCEV